MVKGYSEDYLIEQPAIELFKSLKYKHINCFNETFGTGGTLGRETPSDVVLIPRLKDALQKLNPDLPNEAIILAIEELTRDRSSLNPVVANKEVYKMLRDGVRVDIRQDDGEEETETVKVIDFDNPENNDFFLASQLWITGEMYKRRADLVGFVNGLPLIFIELKAIHKKLENAFKDNIKDYKDTIPQVFWYNAFIIVSNGSQSRIGSITANFEHFSEWKKINSEGEEGIVSLETIIKGTCEKNRFIDLLEHFILYQDIGGSLIKIMAKNHQYIGVNNTIESFKKIKENQGRLGVFWHTQGSGKSFSMVFFSQKVMRKFKGNYTFLIVTDRRELDRQIYENFASVGAVIENEVHAESREHLKQLLKEDHRNIFTLIQKFGTEGGEAFPKLSDRSDIIVMTDEAHRSQYDTLAMNMRTALPNAAFIAFTGTPLIVGEELTRKTFGDYVSIYNFKQSVDDGATVPLYYENRIPEVQLTNDDLNEDFQKIIEESMLDDEQEKKLEREFSRQYHIITRDDRLERIAEDIVEHFMGRGYQGKAMVLSVDKPTAVKMYDKVHKHWKLYINRLKTDLAYVKSGGEREGLKEKITFMEKTDMAVVVSSEQNEMDKFNKLGLDIISHRKRMNDEDLATKFKDPDNSFRIVFVCAMWMTGFDVQCLSTIYLDKPMKNHTLMQAIARANRVFKDKPNGLIVDYVGVFRNLQKALAIYGSSSGGRVEEGDTPVKPKEELVKELQKAVADTKTFCKEKGIDTGMIGRAGKLEKIKMLDEAVDAILINDESKKKYLFLETNVRKLYKAILPDPKARNFTEICALFYVMAEKINALSPDVDISEVMGKVEKLLDESIAAEGYIIEGVQKPIDLSLIDFDALKKKFMESEKHIETEKLKGAINSKLTKMVRLNRTRINLTEKFQQMIDEYNSGAINIEIFFDKLLIFAKELNKEEQRKISENLSSEEELALFDLLYKPGLTNKEKNQVKVAAKDLLGVLKREKLVLDWRKRQQARADVLYTIQTVLDKELPRSYTPEVFRQKCDFVYQHVYDSYYGAGQSVYVAA
ncbi:MAG TPA: type I restriction endonuclease subunit R [Syntrophorhabdaceae bacterium]|nr:type I restriction endonuclease subunit R [Syntrophorhabdaceae bacterium]HOG39991.1 type I restriction endonuclease subunit R [Syntrophorhabdaceae bacterium]